MARSYNFLIIDDNDIDLLVSGELVREETGLANEVTKFQNGIDGLEWLKSYDKEKGELIILLDIKMPMMDGFQFMEEFEKLSSSVKDGVRVFMLSSTLDPRDSERARQNPYVVELLNKPLEPQTIVRLLDQ